MCGVIGRDIDREASLDGRSDQAPVLDSDGIVAEDGLVGKGDRILAGVGGDKLVEERAVDRGTISREVACLGIAPQTAGPKRRDLGAELRPRSACRAAGRAVPVDGEGASFSVAAVFVECAAGPARRPLDNRRGDGASLRVLRNSNELYFH